MEDPPGPGGRATSAGGGGGGVETIALGARACSRAATYLGRVGAEGPEAVVEQLATTSERQKTIAIRITGGTVAPPVAGAKPPTGLAFDARR